MIKTATQTIVQIIGSPEAGKPTLVAAIVCDITPADCPCPEITCKQQAF